MSDEPDVVADSDPAGGYLDGERLRGAVARAFDPGNYRGKRVLVIVPDGTRSGPIDVVFRALADTIMDSTAALDVLVALGTHAPMSESAICARIGLSAQDRAGRFARTGLFNHAWNDPSALRRVGSLSTDEVYALTEGRLSLEVPVDVNRRVFDYDQTVIIGPVFPHEVIGFSGGNKYFFPGVSGAALLNFFHWLGAIVTSPKIMGHADTPIRRVVDTAAAMIAVDKRCIALVAKGEQAAGIFIGTPEAAWRAATPVSARVHITEKDRAFHTVLSCVPAMYDDLWTGGKGMYKLDPVVADGGELILYAPHITEISVTHGKTLREIGYHCRDYFMAQWDRFKNYPWVVVAQSTHVRGVGTFENGVERCRIRVTLASGVSREVCESINLGYRDPATIRPDEFAGREDQGVLCVPKAGETLFRLKS